MSRNKDYQRLLNDKRWMETKRLVWQRAKGLCERCLAEGIITQGVDCHHIHPVESAKSPQEMERLCYDSNNIQLLCVPCHVEVHKQLKSHDPQTIKDRKELAHNRWVEQMQAKFAPKADTPPGEPPATTNT